MRSRNNEVIFLKTHYDLDMLCDFLCYSFVLSFVLSFVFAVERGYEKLRLTHPQLCRWLKQTRNEKDVEVFVHGCVFRMVVIGVDNAPPRRHYSLSLGMSNPPMLTDWWRPQVTPPLYGRSGHQKACLQWSESWHDKTGKKCYSKSSRAKLYLKSIGPISGYGSKHSDTFFFNPSTLFSRQRILETCTSNYWRLPHGQRIKNQ